MCFISLDREKIRLLIDVLFICTPQLDQEIIISLDIERTDLKFGNTHMAGTVSQILHFGPSSLFMKSRKIICKNIRKFPFFVIK